MAGGGELDEDAAQGVEVGSGDVETDGFAEWGDEEAFNFQRPALFEVDEGGSPVGTHLAGAIDLELGVVGGDGQSAGVGGGNDFIHQAEDLFKPSGIGEELIRSQAGGERVGGGEGSGRQGWEAGCGGDAETVEGDVPDELLPMGEVEVRGDFTRDATLTEGVGDEFSSKRWSLVTSTSTGELEWGVRVVVVIEFAEDDAAMGDVFDLAGAGAVDADKAQAAEDLSWGEELGERLLVAEPVLQGQHGGVWADQRGQQPRELPVGSGLETDHHEIDDSDFGRVRGGVRVNGEITIGTADLNTVGSNGGEVGSEEEMDVMTGSGETGAVIGTEGTTSNDGDLHGVRLGNEGMK